jgi:hypothetical protein
MTGSLSVGDGRRAMSLRGINHKGLSILAEPRGSLCFSVQDLLDVRA